MIETVRIFWPGEKRTAATSENATDKRVVVFLRRGPFFIVYPSDHMLAVVGRRASSL